MRRNKSHDVTWLGHKIHQFVNGAYPTSKNESELLIFEILFRKLNSLN